MFSYQKNINTFGLKKSAFTRAMIIVCKEQSEGVVERECGDGKQNG